MAAPLAARPASPSMAQLMRAGYAGRAGVYVIVGVLALLAAWRGGAAEGTRDALAQVARNPWGDAALILVGLGLLAYAMWRAVDAALDLEGFGAGAKGLAARGAMMISGLVHLGLAVYCADLVLNAATSGGGGAQGLTARLLSEPWGRWAVMAAGAGVIGAGVYYAAKGANAGYRREMRATETTRRLDPVLRAGLPAQGGVLGLVGAFILWAGWTHDASEAGGVGRAFAEIREAPWGQALLVATAAGLVAFSVYNAVRAWRGIAPRAAEADVTTLGGRSVGEITGRVEHAARKTAGR